MEIICPKCYRRRKFRRTDWIAGALRIYSCVECGHEVYYEESRVERFWYAFKADKLFWFVAYISAILAGVIAYLVA